MASRLSDKLVRTPPPCHGSSSPFEKTMLDVPVIRLPPSATDAHSGRGVTPQLRSHPWLRTSHDEQFLAG
eukprot:scaffold99550_cov36-Tisochrysis_lutea.AAC.1